VLAGALDADDPMRIETLTVDQGRWPPAPGEILIDRSSFELLNLEVGRDVVVQAPDGQPRTLRVSGVVYYPALAPSFQEQKGHGFMSAWSLPLLGQPLALDGLKIQVADQPGGTVPTRNREAIVAEKGRALGYEIPADVVQYVARKVESNIRELEGALNKIIALGGLYQRNLTLELSNVANLPITIYHGMPIGQISFMRMDGPVERPYGSEAAGSKYQGQTEPTPSRFHRNFAS
jgi:hypothetical protein